MFTPTTKARSFLSLTTVQELAGGSLLKSKSAGHGVTGINDEPKAQRKLSYVAKAEDIFGGLIIVSNLDL